MVERTQSDLDLMETMHDLKLDLQARTVCVADRVGKLAEREFFIYLLFAWLRRTGKTDDNGAYALNDLRPIDLDVIFRIITGAREKELSVDECTSFPRYDFLANLLARIESNKPLDWEEVRKTFTETRARINRKLEDAGIPSRFFLASRRDRGALSYGLAVAPGQIAWD